ncbi:MAG: hypothetical protein RLP09_09675 [Sandaracinaceae bacterium]
MSEVIGTEYRWLRGELDEDELERRERAISQTYEKQRAIEAEFTSFRKWAQPRARAAEDPDYENPDLEGEDEVSIAEAQGMLDELAHRSAVKNSRVGALKAERAQLRRSIAQGYEYRRRECDLVADATKPEVAYVDKATGEEVDRRAMTPDEAQRLLPGTEAPKKKNGKAQTAVV